MPAQQHCDSFRFRRAAFYNGLKSKVGLAAAKTAVHVLPFPSLPPAHSFFIGPTVINIHKQSRAGSAEVVCLSVCSMYAYIGTDGTCLKCVPCV